MKMLTEKQQQALAVLESESNVFITGGAGTGKSFLLRKFIDNQKNKKIIMCAPTGIAAINIGGSTLHRVFGAPMGIIKQGEYQEHPSKALLMADIIVIDEISMCRFDLFEYVIRTIINCNDNKKRQIIVVGDFYQLPPVITDTEREYLDKAWDVTQFGRGYAFKSSLWEAMDFENIVLTEVVRQEDAEFINNLNLLRRGIPKPIEWFNSKSSAEEMENAIYLCGTNSEAENINNLRSSMLDSECYTYRSQIEGAVSADDKPTDDILSLKLGMQIMTIANNEKEGYRNGTVGTVIELSEDSVSIKLLDGHIANIRQKTWEINTYDVENDELVTKAVGSFTQLPIKIAYAITIHKSQGQTYDRVNISPKCFDDGQLYVALSRVTDIKGMHLMQRIHNYDLKVSDDVKFFYRKMR